MSNDIDNEKLHLELLNAQSKLDMHLDYKIKGLILQSRAQVYEQGERNTKFFTSLIKTNQNKSTIRRLKVGNPRTEISDPSQILSEIELFYKNLYSSKGIKGFSLCPKQLWLYWFNKVQ